MFDRRAERQGFQHVTSMDHKVHRRHITFRHFLKGEGCAAVIPGAVRGTLPKCLCALCVVCRVRQMLAAGATRCRDRAGGRRSADTFHLRRAIFEGTRYEPWPGDR